MQIFDVVVIGAGAAGLFCAGQAGQRGLRVLLIDHADKVAEKIRISGGGRCNFTNRDLDPAAPHKYFVGQNPQFCRSALSRYTPQDFIALLERHGIAWHEKHKGQLFADRSAEDIIAMLLAECGAGGVAHWQPCTVKYVSSSLSTEGGESANSYQIDTDRGLVSARSLVIATGGLSIPKIGASDFGYRLAQQFNVPLVERRPGLVPLTFDGEAWASYAALAGLALPVAISTGNRKTGTRFYEDLLFTHRVRVGGRRGGSADDDGRADRQEPGAPDEVDRAVAHPGTAVGCGERRDRGCAVHGDPAVEVARAVEAAERRNLRAVVDSPDLEDTRRGHGDSG